MNTILVREDAISTPRGGGQLRGFYPRFRRCIRSRGPALGHGLKTPRNSDSSYYIATYYSTDENKLYLGISRGRLGRVGSPKAGGQKRAHPRTGEVRRTTLFNPAIRTGMSSLGLLATPGGYMLLPFSLKMAGVHIAGARQITPGDSGSFPPGASTRPPVPPREMTKAIGLGLFQPGYPFAHDPIYILGGFPQGPVRGLDLAPRQTLVEVGLHPHRHHWR